MCLFNFASLVNPFFVSNSCGIKSLKKAEEEPNLTEIHSFNYSLEMAIPREFCYPRRI